MILFHPSTIVPNRFRIWYRILRVLLFASFLGTGILFAYRTLFPSQSFSFSFTNPDTAKNTLEDPIGKDGASLRKGRIPAGETLLTYAGTVGSFSSTHVSIVLGKDSPKPEDGTLKVSLRKSYRSFFYPTGDPMSVTTKEYGVTVNGVPYLFSADTLRPFVSDRAALSRFPKEKMVAANTELLTIFPPQEVTRVGFREGSLLSDAQGVYAIGGDGKAHPIGSTQAFESLGFHWNDVTPVNEEELGFHKRGKIMLFDAAQPDGTVFHGTDSGSYSVIRNGKRIPVTGREYLDPLLAVTTPIDVSESSLSVSAECTPRQTPFSFLNPTYSCDIPLDALKAFPGGSFAISVETKGAIHASSFQATFQTKPDRGNLGIFLRQIRDRFSAAYGK